jgi:hypothetical protein
MSGPGALAFSKRLGNRAPRAANEDLSRGILEARPGCVCPNQCDGTSAALGGTASQEVTHKIQKLRYVPLAIAARSEMIALFLYR